MALSSQSGEPTSVRDAWRDAEHALAAAGIEDARTEALFLLEHILRVDTAQLFLRLDKNVPPGAAKRFSSALERRLAHEPLAYITGHQGFYGLDFLVDSRVLVPRPDTETVVDAALSWAKKKERPLVAVDVGTGSGCIALALAANNADLRIYAIDSSPKALTVARKNARRLDLADRLMFLKSDLLEAVPGIISLLVANLPYIPNDEIEHLMPEVRAHEPRLALDGGDDGLDLVHRVIDKGRERMAPDGSMFFEIGLGQGSAARAYAARAFPFAAIRLLPDLAGIDRVLAIYLDPTDVS